MISWFTNHKQNLLLTVEKLKHRVYKIQVKVALAPSTPVPLSRVQPFSCAYQSTCKMESRVSKRCLYICVCCGPKVKTTLVSMDEWINKMQYIGRARSANFFYICIFSWLDNFFLFLVETGFRSCSGWSRTTPRSRCCLSCLSCLCGNRTGQSGQGPRSGYGLGGNFFKLSSRKEKGNGQQFTNVSLLCDRCFLDVWPN